MRAIGQLVDGDVTLCEGCVFDYLTIQWDNVNLSQHDLDLWLPLNPLNCYHNQERLKCNGIIIISKA